MERSLLVRVRVPAREEVIVVWFVSSSAIVVEARGM